MDGSGQLGRVAVLDFALFSAQIRMVEGRRMRPQLSSRMVVAVSAALFIAASVATIADARRALGGNSGHAVTIRVTLAWSGSSWQGTFVSSASGGRVVDHGRAIDKHEKNGFQLSISRTLIGKAGTLRFEISGPYTQSSSRAVLTWTLFRGTGAYAGLNGTGRDVENISGTHAVAEMNSVPTR